MNITDVKVFPVDEEKLKAYATITFENCFIVRDLKVISGNKGFFIAMPSKKRKDGTFRDVAHPLNSETRKLIENAVLEVYLKTEGEGVTSMPQVDDGSQTDDGSLEQVETTVSEPEITAEPEVTAEPEIISEPEITSEPEIATDMDEGSSEVSDEPEESAEPAEVSEIEQAEPVTEDPADEPAENVEIAEETSAENIDSLDEQQTAPEKGAEENPTIDQPKDPEKAFGYEE